MSNDRLIWAIQLQAVAQALLIDMVRETNQMFDGLLHEIGAEDHEVTSLLGVLLGRMDTRENENSHE